MICSLLAFELVAYPPSMFNADGKNECRHVQIDSKTQTTSDYIHLNFAQSQTLWYMTCLYFSVLSPGRLANCVSTWTPLRRSSISSTTSKYHPRV